MPRLRTASRANCPSREDVVGELLQRWQSREPEIQLAPAGVLERAIRLSRLFEREADVLCNSFGISLWEFSVLQALLRGGPPHELTPTDLYRTGMLTSGGMTKRLKSLEADGYVDRVPAEDDRRSVQVRLTRKGRRLAQRIAPRYARLQGRFVAALSEREVARLAGMLRTLLLDIEDDAAFDS